LVCVASSRCLALVRSGASCSFIAPVPLAFARTSVLQHTRPPARSQALKSAATPGSHSSPPHSKERRFIPGHSCQG
jgi:hypothetical protein